MNRTSSVIRISVVSLLVAFNACSPRNPYNQSYVAGKVKGQSQQELKQEKKVGKFDLPPSVQAADGLTEAEAVSIALWNNAQFQTDMVALKFAEADLTEAGQMPNPTFRYLSANGGIVSQVIMYFYIDALVQRPFRVAASKRDAKRVADNLVQRTFTLIRDVQSAYADLRMARERSRFTTANTAVRKQIAGLALSRLRNGDISELEATAAQVDSVNAIENFLRLAQDTVIMNYRFNTMLGFTNIDSVIPLQTSAPERQAIVSKEELVTLAFENNPELQAAVAAMEAAGKKIGWERSRVLAYSLVLNGQNFSTTPPENRNFPTEFDLGAQIEIPIFNRNRGRIKRAKAELEQASFQYVALRQRIAVDVSESYERYQVAAKSYQLWSGNVIPQLENAVKLARENYATGDISYLPVLENTRLMLDARLRESEVEGELRKAVAQLNYRIGKSMTTN